MTETTDSALMLALASLCSMLPQGLLAPLGGVVADRFNRKYVLIAADAFVGTMALIMGMIIAMGHVSVPLVLIMGALRSVGQAFHMPAMESTMPLLVPKKARGAREYHESEPVVYGACGRPGSRHFLVYRGGLPDGSVPECRRLRRCVLGSRACEDPRFPRRFRRGASSYRKFLKAGFATLSADRGLLILCGIVMAIMAMYTGINSLFPLMTYDHFHGDGYAASLIEGIYGAFSLVGIAILFIWGGGKRLLRVVAFSGTFSGIILIATGLLSPSMFFWFAVLTAISGVVESMYNGPLSRRGAKRVPPEKLGRVMGLFSTVTALFLRLSAWASRAPAQNLPALLCGS